jgi:heat shock protein HslJ
MGVGLGVGLGIGLAVGLGVGLGAGVGLDVESGVGLGNSPALQPINSINRMARRVAFIGGSPGRAGGDVRELMPGEWDPSPVTVGRRRWCPAPAVNCATRNLSAIRPRLGAMNALGRLGLTTVTLLLVACVQAPGASPTPSPSPAPSPTPTPSAPAGLAGRQFLSTGVTKDGAPFALVAGSRIRLTFSAGQLSASAGCNTIGGNLTIDGNRLVFTGAGMTEMGCEPPLMAQDTWLGAFLGSGLTFALDGNNLTLTGGTTVVTLLDREVAEPDQPLVGRTWTLAGFISGDVASSVPQGISATFTFNADGRVDIHYGCNSGGGKYVVDGDSITFSELIQTEMACTGAAGQVEQQIVAVITADAITFAIDANSLSLQAGAAGLQFISDAQQ